MTAAVAGAGVALAGIVVLQAVALTGWFFADGGAHGNTKDALRVGADAWLVAHGSHLSFAGVDYTVVPLGLSLLLAWAAYRAGRWAGTAAVVSSVDRGRDVGWAVGLFGSGYVVVTVVTAVLAGTDVASGNLALSVLGALVIGLGAGSLGLIGGTDSWHLLRDRLPGWVWPAVRSALVVVLGLLSGAALLVTVSFVLHLGSAASLVSELGLAPGDAVMLVLLCAVLAPNAVLLGAAYVVGPGFAIGAGTTISPSVVALGPMPAFPLLAALPDDGATPWFATATMALPPLAAALGVALVQRRHPVRAWDLSALRGIASGALAGLLTGILTALGGGALGDGRMADIGAPAAQVLVSAVLSMGLGGLLGALVTTFFQRRRPLEEAGTAPITPGGTGDTDGPRVLVPSRPDEETVQLSRAAPGEESFGARELRSRFIQQTARRPENAEGDSGPDSEDTVQVTSD